MAPLIEDLKQDILSIEPLVHMIVALDLVEMVLQVETVEAQAKEEAAVDLDTLMVQLILLELNLAATMEPQELV